MRNSKIIFSLILTATLFLWSGAVLAEQIDSFSAEFKVNQDASLVVKETINYDFGSVSKHGLYRTIPYIYRDEAGKKSEIVFSDFKVEDGHGNKYNFSKSRDNGNWLLKIGDADVLVSGKKTYVVSYEAKDALKYFSDHDELYWDVIGDAWTIPILRADAKVTLPQNLSKEKLQQACYYGVYGSTSSCQGSIDDQGVFNFSHEQILSPDDGLTIVAGWPKGLVKEPGAWDRFLKLFARYCPLLVPLIVLVWLVIKWFKSGRDPKGQGTIIAQFEAPDKLLPVEVGALLDERVDGKDISSEIINLAVLGYLKIVKIAKDSLIKVLLADDYLLIKLKSEDDGLSAWQKQLMTSLFAGKQEVALSDLKKDFYRQALKLEKALYKSLTEKKYFANNPLKVRTNYSMVAALFFIFGIALFYIITAVIFRLNLDIFWLLGSFFLSSMLFVIFSPLMPKKTEKGVLAKEHILGLKLYLTVAEKDRLEFHNAPEKNPEHFEKLLPYAIALKVEKKWAEQFKDLYNYQPTWYSDSTSHNLGALAFADSLSQFTALTNAVASPNQNTNSSGSGFSGGHAGGGGGGGGGGSW